MRPESVSVEADTAADERADLGVLFVHGIGEQRQGQTLSQFGEPVIGWIRDWLFRKLPQGASVAAVPIESRLAPPLLDVMQPAHAEVLIGTDVQGGPPAQRWMFAEAWWAPQVLVPPIASFTGWLLTRASWMLLFHLHQCCLSSERSKIVLILRALFVLVVWFVLSTIGNIALIIASLAGLIPMASVRKLVYGALRAIAGIVGDSYALIRSPFQRAAFEESTVAALRWLQAKSKRLAVVAHSQGAAVARGALSREGVPRVDLLVTVGAGITKLEALRWFENLPANQRIAASLAPSLLMLGGYVAVRVREMGLDEFSYTVAAPGLLILFGFAMLLVAWFTVRQSLIQLRKNSTRLALREPQPALKWIDLHASSDPVPAGPVTHFFDLDGVESHKVTVLRSMLRDHTSYWSVGASFFPKLVQQLGLCAQTQLFDMQENDPRLLRGNASHTSCLRVLALSTGFDVAALALPLTFERERLIAAVDALRKVLVGGSASDPNVEAPFSFVDQIARSSEHALRWFARDVAGGEALWARDAVNWAMAAIMLLGVLLVWRRIAFVLWRTWAGNRYEEAVQQGAMELPGASAGAKATLDVTVATKLAKWTVNGGLGTLLLVPLGLSLTWSFKPDWVSEKTAFFVLGGGASLLFAVFAVAAMLIHAWTELESIRVKFSGWRRVGEWLWSAPLRNAVRSVVLSRRYVLSTCAFVLVIGIFVSKLTGWSADPLEDGIVFVLSAFLVLYLVANRFEMLRQRMERMQVSATRQTFMNALPLVVLIGLTALYVRAGASLLSAALCGAVSALLLLCLLTWLHRAGKPKG